MKCEKCGKEATFHYQSIINNVKTENHLCAECAESDGMSDVFTQTAKSMMDGLWGNPFGMQNAFSPFVSGGMFIPTMAWPMLNVFMPNPETSTKALDQNTDNIPEDAGETFRAKREISALRHQMEQAVKAEEFEKAAELRDKIREMER